MTSLSLPGLRGLGLVLAACAALALSGCETPGKIAETSTFDISQASPDDIGKALRRDGKVAMTGVLFETDSARLSAEGKDLTARLANVLINDPELKVAVVGHTDNTGAFTYNLDLSRRRAEAMVNELIRVHGIAQDRLAPVGVGPLAPVASNETPDGRAQNRRVEAVLIQ
ncbi:OmpA family protein [Limibaculum sp. M0105]|uniref:OmpA family protein n=1 Tax=Thermohalobaculum xanthum TaxID=2753746 RepID=A0A8J7M828_9RHOB|nr:OmpA family protein [Thermohalobaculum xanthum]MBK0399393.1 OmpA family protein [Thermohalobaculum xanthum]